MGVDLAQLLSAPVYRAYDVDEAGRILAGTDESGSMQLAELSPDGSRQPLTALPGPCRGRYLPGERVVLVGHDDGGNERGQLSLLRLPLTGGSRPGSRTWSRSSTTRASSTWWPTSCRAGCAT